MNRVRGRAVRLMAMVLATAMCVGLIGIQPALGAAQTFEGGPIDHLQYCPNDHTAFGLRWEATSGLSASTAYYVKLRFTEDPSPSPSTNRGFTWNAATGQWVQEGSDWTAFPQVTTDVSGQVTGNAGWVFGKFGDDRASGSYYLMVSLKPVEGGDTYNSADPPTVTVIDMETDGSWVHNGVATGANTARRVEVTEDTTDTIVYTLSKTEANLIDDDSNGTVDDEDYGPAGTTGDFRFGVPASASVDILINRTTTWLDDYTTGIPDTDVAAGAADETPPTAPLALAADSSDPSQVALTWQAAAGATGYRVFRWVEAPANSSSTPLHEPIAEVTGLSYTDTDIDLGVTYSYEVRAFDDATNVGPRSDTVLGGTVPEPTVERAEGLNRYATAAAVSEAAFETANRVVLATGAAYPDALAAAGLAGAYDCPLLLTGPDTLPDVTTAEIERLGATKVTIVGGVGAVSQGVGDKLAATYEVTRIGGADRYETAALIAEEIVSRTSATSAFFARGDNFADALAAGPYAFSGGLPILLVRTGSVPAVTAEAIDDLSLAQGIVVGGTGAVSNETLGALDTAMPGGVDRVAGDTRYETAVALAQFATGSVGFGVADWGFVGLATGQNFPDALSGGVATGKMQGVLLLTRTDALPASTHDAIAGHTADIHTVMIFGGVGAVSQDVEDAVTQLIE